MPSRYTFSLASRVRPFPKLHVFLWQPRRPNKPILPPTPSSRSYSEGPSKPWYKHPKLSPMALLSTAGVTALGFFVYTGELSDKSWYEKLQIRTDESACISTTYDTLKKGPKVDLPPRVIPREDIVNLILTAITPTEKHRGYPFIVGEHGTGKSTLIALALERLEEPKGVIYIQIPGSRGLKSNFNFANAMKKALGLKPNLVDNSALTIDHGLEIFSHAAAKYKQDFKKIPVLIIDGVDQLAELEPATLATLQEYAKGASDHSTATLVFVSSEGYVPLQMGEESSWSRHGMIHEIGDISKEETLKYLEDQGIKGEQASQIYELVGGRIVHLNQVVELMLNGKTVQEVQKSISTDVGHQLSKAKMNPRSPDVKGVSVIRKLLEEGPISMDTYFDIMGEVPGTNVLQKNVFSGNCRTNEVDFQSTVMRRYCEEKWGRGKEK